MVRLYIGETWTEVEGLPSSLHLKLDSALSAPVDGYFFARKNNPNWDGRIHLFRYGKFPTGLVGLVINLLRPHVPLQVIDMRRKVTYSVSVLPDLRDYQKKALEKALYLRTGIIHHPTGSGKTLIIASLFNCFKDRPKLYLAHRLDLVTQTQAMLRKFGVIGNESTLWINGNTTLDSNTLFATFQTCRKLLNTPESIQVLKQIDLLCVDEVHNLPADTFFRLAMKVEAPYRIGFSATPLHDNPARNLKLIGALGPIIDVVDPSELITQGYLAKPTIIFIDLDIPSIEPLIEDYSFHYDAALVNCEERNRAICKLVETCISNGLNVMVLVRRLTHGKILSEMLNAPFLSGINDISVRRQAIEDFENGKCRVLIASTIFDEGVDIKRVNVLIIASGGASSMRALQRAGRGLRPAQGKSKVFIFDFLDKHNGFLRRHASKRLKAYSKVYNDIKKASLMEAMNELSKS